MKRKFSKVWKSSNASLKAARFAGIGKQAFQDEMLPEEATVLGAQIGPAARKGHKSGIEAVNLGLADKFAFPAPGVGANDGGDMCEFQHIEICEHCGAAQTAKVRERRGLHLSAAHSQNALDELEEASPFLDTEEFLHITGIVGVEPLGVKAGVINAGDAVARRSIGAKTAACFSADHTVSRLWANALMNAGADGILYESTRHSPGQCLALFQTKAASACLSAVQRICSSYDNSNLLAELFAEGVSIIGP